MWKTKLNEILQQSGNPKLLKVSYSGSKLYGTDTPNSDIDIRFIFLPSFDSLITESSPKQISYTSNTSDNSKNSKDDFDIQGWSLTKFVNLLNKGDSLATSFLFSPEIQDREHIDDSLYLDFPKRVKFLEQCLAKLKVPKKVSGMIGFAKSQAYRYSQRGEKLQAAEILRDLPR